MKETNQQLASVMEHISSAWVCDEKRYPELAGKNESERLNFVVKHSLLHINKTTGKLAALCEDFDHTDVANTGDVQALQDLSVKMFVNALKLAEEAGLSAQDLLVRAPAIVK